MKVLRTYQENAINELARKASQGWKKLLLQLATGSGKTVTFCALINRYLARNQRKVLILVHRAELLQQARATLYNWYGIIAEPVTAGTRTLPNANVYVAMVETANNRLKRNPDYFGDVGLLIVDECHIGNFKKLYSSFSQSLIIGFTATPISGSKKDPLKNHFDDIVCGIDIPELIIDKALVPNVTYHIRNIKRGALKIKNGEYDSAQMGTIYSSPKHVENCVKGYERFALGTKTLVFNCNVAHSKLTNECFLLHGYNSRHLDANCTDQERAEAIRWFEETDGAILNNVGLFTTGFDSPATFTVIVNKSTLSLPLWLQMTGRGSRPYENKDHFTIIDMGGNALFHGDWCASRDWADIFHYPDKPTEGGVAPVKECCSCEAIISASATLCKFCGADNSKVPVYDSDKVEFELLTRDKPFVLNVTEVIGLHQDKKEYYALHQIKNSLVSQAKYKWGMKTLSDTTAYKLLELYQSKVKEWCHAKDKPYNTWHKQTTTEWFFEELKRVFKWEPQKLSIAV